MKRSRSSGNRPRTRAPESWAAPSFWTRLARIAAVVSFGPDALEQFETPKAAVVRAIGLGALSAALLWPAGVRRIHWQPLDFAVAAGSRSRSWRPSSRSARE